LDDLSKANKKSEKKSDEKTELPEEKQNDTLDNKKVNEKTSEPENLGKKEKSEEEKIQVDESVEEKTISEEPAKDKTSEEKPETQTAEPPKTEEPKKDETPLEKPTEPKPEQPQKDEIAAEKNPEPKTEEPIKKDKPETPITEEPVKKEKTDKSKAEDKDPKKKEDDDFNYIVRIANTDIDGNKKVVHGLTSIKGVGMHIATLVIDKAGINKKIKVGNLSDAQIDKIRKTLDEITDIAPSWMLNHRKDYETGEDIHLIGPEIDMRLRDEINIMKKIRCYRGIRHERGLPARGQRTRANNRRGLALGVSKKRETK